MKINGKFLHSGRSSFVRGLLPIPGNSRIIRNSGSDLMSRRDISIKILSCNVLKMLLSNVTVAYFSLI